MKLSFAFKEAAAVNNIWNCYRDAEDALSESKRRILRIIRDNKKLPLKYEFMTLKEVANQFDQNFKELKYATILGLVSAIEAGFIIDHQFRINGQKQDAISKEFLRLRKKQKRKGEWTKLGDDILTIWKDIASNIKFEKAWRNKASIAIFKKLVILLMGILDMRDWIAHGRCWERRSTQNYDRDDIYSLAKRLIENLPYNNFYGRQYLMR